MLPYVQTFNKNNLLVYDRNSSNYMSYTVLDENHVKDWFLLTIDFFNLKGRLSLKVMGRVRWENANFLRIPMVDLVYIQDAGIGQ